MPMELADQINQVDDLNEFLHEFVDENSLDNATSFGHPRDAYSRKRKFFIFLLIRRVLDEAEYLTLKYVEVQNFLDSFDLFMFFYSSNDLNIFKIKTWRNKI
jgi:hypothetical protein